jgi:hypothetical protein
MLPLIRLEFGTHGKRQAREVHRSAGQVNTTQFPGVERILVGNDRQHVSKLARLLPGYICAIVGCKFGKPVSHGSYSIEGIQFLYLRVPALHFPGRKADRSEAPVSAALI